MFHFIKSTHFHKLSSHLDCKSDSLRKLSCRLNSLDYRQNIHQCMSQLLTDCMWLNVQIPQGKNDKCRLLKSTLKYKSSSLQSYKDRSRWTLYCIADMSDFTDKIHQNKECSLLEDILCNEWIYFHKSHIDPITHKNRSNKKCIHLHYNLHKKWSEKCTHDKFGFLRKYSLNNSSKLMDCMSNNLKTLSRKCDRIRFLQKSHLNMKQRHLDRKWRNLWILMDKYDKFGFPRRILSRKRNKKFDHTNCSQQIWSYKNCKYCFPRRSYQRINCSQKDCIKDSSGTDSNKLSIEDCLRSNLSNRKCILLMSKLCMMGILTRIDDRCCFIKSIRQYNLNRQVMSKSRIL